MRAIAHITSAGDLLRIPQHASVISGTSTVASISGENHQRDGVIGVEYDAELGEQPCETVTQLGFRLTRQVSAGDIQHPSIVGGQLRLPRSRS
jgi:hypothetical protein